MLMPTAGGAGGGGGGGFTVSTFPTLLYGFRNTFGTVTTSTAATASASGGTPPYTYEAEFVAGETAIYPVNPGASTKFAIYIDLLPMSYFSTYRFKVTDGLGNVAYGPDIFITLETTYGGGGGFTP